jgi:hypothetical protein
MADLIGAAIDKPGLRLPSSKRRVVFVEKGGLKEQPFWFVCYRPTSLAAMHFYALFGA